MARSKAFYGALLEPLGYICVWSNAAAAGYGSPGQINEPFAGVEHIGVE